MSKQITFVVLILLISLFSGCQSQAQDSAEIEQVKQQLAAIESRLDELAQNTNASDLEAQIAALEQKINTIEASDAEPQPEGEAPAQVFQVAMATYLLDTAGFHGLDERINEEGVIMPADAGVVQRVQRVLAKTDWPDELQEQADQLLDILSQYAEALSNDDIEAAKPLATQTHEVQHDFSHAVEQWLAGQSGGTEHQEEGGEHDHEEEQEHGEEHGE